jgi:hypothetical protein
MRHGYHRSKLPLMLSILYSVPLFMLSILCASLAIDRPVILKWTTNLAYPGVTELKKTAEKGVYIAIQYQNTSNATEWRIWGWAILPPLIVIGAGILFSFVRYGAYIVSVLTIVVTIAVTHHLDRWFTHHRERYPYGYDNIPDNTTKPGIQSNFDTGQWESSARETVISIRMWLIIGACAAIALMILTEVRRRRGKRWEDVIIGHTDPGDVHIPPDGSPGAQAL